MIVNLTLLHADKGADQPVHTLSLISAFAIHLMKCMLDKLTTCKV